MQCFNKQITLLLLKFSWNYVKTGCFLSYGPTWKWWNWYETDSCMLMQIRHKSSIIQKTDLSFDYSWVCLFEQGLNQNDISTYKPHDLKMGEL